MAAFEVAVIRATNFCVGMFLDLAALFPAPGAGWVVWTFKFHPVDPDRWRVAVTVFLFEGVVSIPKRFEVAVVGLFLLHRELANRIGGDLKRDFDRFGVLDGSGDLMRADGRSLESPVSALD